MTAQELLRAGRLNDSLARLQEEVRAAASDEKLRVFLFQLLCVLGKWDRALTQLQVLASMPSDALMLARIFEPVLRCERLRQEVFAGKRTPIIFGEPEEWVGGLVKANELVGQGKADAARELRDRAFEAAPGTSGKLNGQDFQWIADADQRLGPVLEVILEGRYCWVPFHRIRRIVTEKPSDLRDLVWLPAQFAWSNGGEATGHIPTRYAGTELDADDALRLARGTRWTEPTPDFSVGLGQRVLATDAQEFPLLECRMIELEPASG